MQSESQVHGLDMLSGAVRAMLTSETAVLLVAIKAQGLLRTPLMIIEPNIGLLSI